MAAEKTDGIGFLQQLKEALAVANMKRDSQNQAVTWCETRGTNSLSEVMEVFDEFASQLGLKPLEKRRLEKAMNGAIERYGGAAKVVTEDAKASAPSGVDANKNAEMALTKAPTTETEKEAPKETAEDPEYQSL